MFCQLPPVFVRADRTGRDVTKKKRNTERFLRAWVPKGTQWQSMSVFGLVVNSEKRSFNPNSLIWGSIC